MLQNKKKEKLYRKNFCKTAKSVTNGTFGEEESSLTFSRSIGDAFYKDKCEREVIIDPNQLNWFLKVENQRFHII